jgi:hypothetical protein
MIGAGKDRKDRHVTRRSQSQAGWPNPLVLILCFLAPPLGLLAWVLGNGAHRAAYLRSWWVRAGLTLLLLGAAPLVTIIVAANVGLWPDPNPNPVGPGMLFFFSGILATGCLAIGAVWVWLELR